MSAACPATMEWGQGPYLRPKPKAKEGRGDDSERRNEKGGMMVVGHETVVAATKHGGGHSRHDRLGLNVQVPIHLVGAPAANEPDAIAIDAGAQHGHGATGAGGAGRDVGGRDAQVRREEHGGT